MSNKDKLIWEEIHRLELKNIIETIAPAALIDNDGEVVGYNITEMAPNHEDYIKCKNEHVAKGLYTQQEFEIILFNYIENNEIISIVEAKKIAKDIINEEDFNNE